MLILRLQTPDDTEFACALLADKAYEADWSLASWDKIKPLLSGQQVVVLIPSSDVLLTQTTLSTRNARQLKQALPFALEDGIAGDLDSQHYVWQADTDNKEQLHVAVMDKARLQVWQETLQEQGVKATMLLPDVFALPWQEGSLAVWQQGGQTWVRNGRYAGFTCPDDAFPFVVEQLDMSNSEQRLYFYSDSAAHTKLNINQVESDPDTLLRESLESAAGFNLLANFQTEAQSMVSAGWRRWRVAAVVALLALGLLVGIKGMEVQQLRTKLAQVEQQNIDTFRELFPEVNNINPRSIRSRARSEMSSLQRGKPGQSEQQSPLPRLAVLAKAFAAKNKLNIKEVRVRNNKMIIRFESPDLATLDQLEQVLSEATGDTVSIRSTRTAKNVNAQLTLALGGAS